MLRTLPQPEAWAIERLRRTARALDIDWPAAQSYPDFIRSLDPARPRHVAMMVACTTVLRGAAYVAFNGELPAQADALGPGVGVRPRHCAAATAGGSLHRRNLRCVVRAATGTRVGAAARCPDCLRRCSDADRRASRFERAVLDLVESVTLAPRVGEVFDGTIVDVQRNDPRQGVVDVARPGDRSAGRLAIPIAIG